MAVNLAQKQFLTWVRPVVCSDGKFYGRMHEVKKLWKDKVVVYNGTLGVRNNHFAFNGASTDFPAPLVTHEKLLEIKAALGAIPDGGGSTAAAQHAYEVFKNFPG